MSENVRASVAALLLTSSASAAALIPHSPGRYHVPAPLPRATGAFATVDCKAGPLLRVTHVVDAAAPVAAFYEGCLGLSATQNTGGSTLVGASRDGDLGLELVTQPGGKFTAGRGYSGLMARVPSVAAAAAAAAEYGGQVLIEPTTVTHGPSRVPEEDDELDHDIVEAVVSDPCGYPLLLYEVDGADAALCGARLDAYEWKRAEEWWNGIGWKTLRWQSNVPNEASITLTLSNAPGDAGPRGPPPPAGGVVQVTYQYAAAPIDVGDGSGLHALVLAAANVDEAGAKLKDADGNPVALE